MKDNFSTRSDNYAKYRPTYPQELFTFLYSLVKERKVAWDCGTGNGQVAKELSKNFERVFATDISRSQLDNAFQEKNIQYSQQPAEKTNFPGQIFDLVVVAQAIHWFDFDRFYAEVKRTCKRDALLTVIGYGLLEISPEIDAVIFRFYTDVLGKYWDPERRYIDEHYQTIPFPFQEVPAPVFSSNYNWTLEHLLGYLDTWSAVKHFIRENGTNPLDVFREKITPFWKPGEVKTVRFPLLLRVGKVHELDKNW